MSGRPLTPMSPARSAPSRAARTDHGSPSRVATGRRAPLAEETIAPGAGGDASHATCLVRELGETGCTSAACTCDCRKVGRRACRALPGARCRIVGRGLVAIYAVFVLVCVCRLEDGGTRMFTVATWNLENLYRPGGVYGPKTDALYRSKLQQLAATITTIGPDVFAVQEVGQPEALADLVALLAGRWYTTLSTHPDVRGIRVGLLTRRKPTSHTDIVELAAGLAPVQSDDTGAATTQMGRGALRVTVKVGTVAVEVVTAHLKSKLLTFPGGRFSPSDENQRARFAAYAIVPA